MTTQSTPPPQSRNSSNGAGVKTIRHPLSRPDLTAADYFLSRQWSQSCLASRCPRRASRSAGIRSSEQSPHVRLCNSVVDRTPRKARPLRQWIVWKGTQNNFIYKMICIKVFAHCIWFWLHLVYRCTSIYTRTSIYIRALTRTSQWEEVRSHLTYVNQSEEITVSDHLNTNN
jgi:hypothetical protein